MIFKIGKEEIPFAGGVSSLHNRSKSLKNRQYLKFTIEYCGQCVVKYSLENYELQNGGSLT